ncbi:MAG TPA: DUF885 domain-containing protein [Candidatus Limnocylindrales bacterium]|nr:DUF885 domain-containing protein [Candidatus Limnocylindrales bacterium]
MTDNIHPSRVNELADRFWEWFLERQPLYATFLGDDRYDDRLFDPSAEARAADRTALATFQVEAEHLAAQSDLDTEERITADMLSVVARIQVSLDEHRLYQLEPIDQMNGPQSLPGELARYQRVDSTERVDRLVSRLESYPAHLEAHRANVEEGRSAGRTAAGAVVERVVEQTRRMVQAPIHESPLLLMHPELDEETRGRLRRVVERHVQPALADHLRYLERYAADARPDPGLWSMPGGEELYRTLILANTTLQLEPQELHDYGMEQIALIETEQERIADELGFDDGAAMRAALDTDPRNGFSRREEMVEMANAQIERASAAAPRYFSRLPRASLEVRAVEAFQEAEAPPAFYLPPAPDGTRGGMYYVNTYQPESRPVHRLAATTFHEAVPGHHFQIAIETELEGLPSFRTLGSRLVGVAYPEGWGLYAERLADEMGLYDGPRERLGMLQAQAWRAARLVVDTGLHHLRWTRDQSIALLRRIGLSQLEAETETDRYIAWPGQALAYMTGMREIVALRRQIEERDGDRFDLSAFHDAVLGHGSLPLATLRHELPGWVAPRQA